MAGTKKREKNGSVGNCRPPKEHQFTSENQPKNRGRKKSKLKGMIEVNDLSSTDVSDLILSMMDKTEDELKSIAADYEKPFLIRSFVKAMLKDMSNDNLYNINNLLDRAVGKPKEKKENLHTTLDENGEEVGMNININFTGD